MISTAGETGLRLQPAPHMGGNNEDVKADNGRRRWGAGVTHTHIKTYTK